jgi:small-conductance mechanosensitive channel
MEKIDFNILEAFRQWSIIHVPKLIIILLGMWLTIKVAKFIGKRIRARVEDDDPTRQSEREKRAETLVTISNTIVKIVVVAFGVLMIVKELGIDIGPLLAGAGIMGLAIGFGSQALVKDVVTGFFILMENQFRVGDVIKAAGHSGLVEKITLRTTILRDLDGTVHVIPNGEVGTVSNMTYIWSRAVIDIGVSYREDIDKVMDLMLQVASGMKDDPKYGVDIIEEPTLLGVDSFDESSVNVRIMIKTTPLFQWMIAREYRRRVKNRFDAEGIVMPFPQRTISLDKDAVEIFKK